MQGVWAISILWKNCNQFGLFPFMNTPSQIIKLSFLHIPSTPLYYNLSFCPPNPLIINHIFSWKSKLKHTGVDIMCSFFKIKNLHQQIIKSVSWKCVMEPSKLELFRKKLTAYSRKQFPQKVSTWDVWESPK